MRLHKVVVVFFVFVQLTIGGALVQAPFNALNGILTTVQADSTTASSLHASDTTQKKVKLIQKTYDHKQQVKLGIGMMAFIAIIFYTVQSLNP